ncbi:hypothetical protein GOP47_0004327 [Adiantum capillus-veneris]|uniref:Uncharacterized protein n=1 Tax=Adiantum capillus-veneris TaxID=13818 RepID=A0A9D4ZMR3_ADICA|nr:hypothetical protein GOP47_0004327 [Adiantum capillus-veneris]
MRRGLRWKRIAHIFRKPCKTFSIQADDEHQRAGKLSYYASRGLTSWPKTSSSPLSCHFESFSPFSSLARASNIGFSSVPDRVLDVTYICGTVAFIVGTGVFIWLATGPVYYRALEALIPVLEALSPTLEALPPALEALRRIAIALESWDIAAGLHTVKEADFSGTVHVLKQTDIRDAVEVIKSLDLPGIIQIIKDCNLPSLTDDIRRADLPRLSIALYQWLPVYISMAHQTTFLVPTRFQI